jgi:hypothetical protein
MAKLRVEVTIIFEILIQLSVNEEGLPEYD